jgi:hypothetical protein
MYFCDATDRWAVGGGAGKELLLALVLVDLVDIFELLHPESRVVEDWVEVRLTTCGSLTVSASAEHLVIAIGEGLSARPEVRLLLKS